LAWLSKNMGATTTVAQKLRQLRSRHEDIVKLATKLKELVSSLTVNATEPTQIPALENLLRMYGFCLIEKISRQKYREVMVSIQEDLSKTADEMTTEEEDRRTRMKAIFALFPHLTQGQPPVFSIRIIDTEESNPLTVEDKDLDTYLALLRENAFVKIAEDLERFRLTLVPKSKIQFEKDRVASPALRQHLHKLREEKVTLEKTIEAMRMLPCFLFIYLFIFSLKVTKIH